MSTEYYASFAPVAVTRTALQSPLEKVFSEMSAQLDTFVNRLELKNGHFEYTGDEITCHSLVDALTQTDCWGGVEINFVYQHQLCSLVIANDIAQKTSVFFCEPGALFEKQWTDPLNRFNLLNLLVNFMKRLGASFCVLEPG